MSISTVLTKSQNRPTRVSLAFLAILTLVALAPSVVSAVDLAQLEEQAIRSAVDRVEKSVVRIQTVGGLERVGKVALGDGPCTGLIVSPDGYIISSSFNFARQPTTILVELPNGSTQAAKLVARDKSRSLALLKVELPEGADPLAVATPVPANATQPGAWAIGVGRTFEADRPNISVGIISGLNRIWGKAIQTDAKISPNNYGGPLVDIQGQVFGILVPLSPQVAGEVAGAEWYDSGIGFAIPMDHILEVLPKLKEGKDLLPGLMGISLRSRDPYGSRPVVAVTRAGSPAYEAGVKTGDEITVINGVAVQNYAQLRHQIAPRYAGEMITMTVLRDDKQVDLSFELADELPSYAHAFLGVLPQRSTESAQDGVTVRFVYPDSPAADAGLLAGDRITGIADAKIDSVKQAYEKMAALAIGEEVEITVQRQDQSQTFTAKVAAMPEDIPLLPVEKPVVETDKSEVATGAIDLRLPEFKNQCLAYVPENYDPNRKYGVVIWLPKPGQVDKEELLSLWSKDCAERDLILLAPQSRDATKWSVDEVEFIHRALHKLATIYKLDSSRVIVYGNGAGGVMAAVYFHSAVSKANGLVVVNSLMPSFVKPRPVIPTVRPAIYWACDPKDAARRDRQLDGLRTANYPVTICELDSSGPLPADKHAELIRWIDSLDRF